MHAPATQPRAQVKEAGVLAEFDTDEAIMEAATKVRDAGFTRWDCHTPFPVHGLDGAMGIRQTILPWLVLGAGLTGVCAACLMQWWMNAVDYQFVVSGKPMWSLPANVPIMFEVMVLFSGLTAFGAMFALNGLPLWYKPQFRSERFRRVTDDKFFVWVDARDPKYGEATAFLSGLGSNHVETVKEVIE